jgi:hypothetical protein
LLQDGDDVYFVQDEHAYLDFYSAISLKQQSVSRHVILFGHKLLLLLLNGEAANTNLIAFCFDLPLD